MTLFVSFLESETFVLQEKNKRMLKKMIVFFISVY